jgi:drug/metabolite transporter (DMT)-like permease
MTKNRVIKGVLLVSLGASSYGMLATFVKLAYAENFTTAEVTVSQFVYGIIGLLLINSFQRIRNKSKIQTPTKKAIGLLLFTGTSMGFTSIFYYIAVKYIPVSIAIVLLMQTVWLSVLLEVCIERKLPETKKIIAVLLVLLGTLLATNIFQKEILLDWRGFFWGFLSAVSFTTTMFASNRIALELSTSQRSLFMLCGGAIVVFIFAFVSQHTPFNFEIFLKWGIIIALFGTIIPPMLLNSGFPYTGIGLGSIVASLELPVSVLMAYFILKETVLSIQWIGIGLIIFANIMLHIKFNKSKLLEN